MAEKLCTSYKSYKDFTSLVAWKCARELKIYFYTCILTRIKNEEKFILAHQIRKALISVTANIAEGYGRYHFKEGIQFYRISRASLYELKDHLITCFDLNYISMEELKIGFNHIEKSKIALNGFIYYTKKQLKNSTLSED